MKYNINLRVSCPDIRCWRAWRDNHPPTEADPGDPRTDLPRKVIHHSPDGHNWGYGGSGPADFALDILATCLPVGCDGLEPVTCWRGKCSQVAWDLHQKLKRDLIASIPVTGTTIQGRAVDAWINGQLYHAAKAAEDASHQPADDNSGPESGV